MVDGGMKENLSTVTSETFVIVIEIPSIKAYVFGTDTLSEVRGASARLNQLNRSGMEQCLRAYPNMAGAKVKSIYANGGTAQFLAHGCDEITVRAACTSMVRHLREQTGGEVRAVYGIAPLQDESSYRESVRMAHFQMRCQREFASSCRSTSLLPAVMECQSASHLPATRIVSRGAKGIRILSEASYEKTRQGSASTGLWDSWMCHLQNTGPWPDAHEWNKLRCADIAEIASRQSSRNCIGVIYADGNAMGQIVQELDQPETFRQFSRIVDESISTACFTALSAVSRPEVDKIRGALEQQHRFEGPLAADILLLGGDDLLVVVPADRALDFASQVANEFERLTREKIAALQDEGTRKFFLDRLGDRGFTISCGVVVAKSNYPFYLSFNLAEQLLKNAKRRDSRDPQPETRVHCARIDFHVVAGANSHKIEDVRQDSYLIRTDAPRTLRPMSCSQLDSLRTGVRRLRAAGFPRSKLHELQEAALVEEVNQADRRIRNIFARCRNGRERPERLALWLAVAELRPKGYAFDFPWFEKDGHRLLCVADLVEAYDLLPEYREECRP